MPLAESAAGITLSVWMLLVWAVVTFGLLLAIVLTIVYQLKRKQYVWAVLTIFFPGILVLVYWIAWLFVPGLKKKKR